MGTQQRAADSGAERARTITFDLAGELRRARWEHGLSQVAVGRASGMSASQVSRIERGLSPDVSIRQAARLLAVVGLELSARAYPAGEPIHDAAHLALMERLRARTSPSIAWRFEVPLPIPGDKRAWDGVLLIRAARTAVEGETRPHDLQSLARRVALKRRDDPSISAVILLLANTRHNRQLLRDEGDVLRADLPLNGAVILEALAQGRDPGGSGIVLL